MKIAKFGYASTGILACQRAGTRTEIACHLTSL